MKRRFIYFPDAPFTSNGNSSATPTKTIRIPKIPRKDADFGAVVTTVAEKWKGNPAITLIWTDASTFERKAIDFNNALEGRNNAGSQRPSQTVTLGKLDAIIQKGISRAKKYIQEHWEDPEDAAAQYARYGILKRGRIYELPRDRDQRLDALELTIVAIVKDGFEDKPFGKAFWTDTRNQYKVALDAASQTDGTVSTAASDKNVLKGELLEIMECLQLVIRANYPKTFAAIFREWGWQREDY